LDAIAKKYPLFTIEGKVVAQMKYPKKGKPKASDEKVISGYEIQTTWGKNDAAIHKVLNKKGRFILATNDMNTNAYPDSEILADYKKQQNVERGFRFIKDPWFRVDSIFLKSPKRIQALMMVMTLCLLVYNVAQYKLRESLKESSQTLPNQLGKPIINPTLRWVFQLMEGISIVRFFRESMAEPPVKEWVTNLNALRKKIITHFGHEACVMYGLIQKNNIRV
jgi:transposase